MFGITSDSRKVKKGYIFVALKGLHYKGLDFINSALENVYTQIAKSPLMLKYLESENAAKRKAKEQILESKKKSADDFLPIFSSKNKAHRSYVVNYYLSSCNKEDMCQAYEVRNCETSS